MSTAQTRLGAAAHNIANALSADFRRQTLITQTRAGGGVDTSFGSAANVGEDLTADLVAQHESLYAFKANLRVIQTADAMLGTLLDTAA